MPARPRSARPLPRTPVAWAALALAALVLLAWHGAAPAQGGDPNKPAARPVAKPVVDPNADEKEPGDETPDAPPPVREGLLETPATDRWETLLGYVIQLRVNDHLVATGFDYDMLRRDEATSKRITRAREQLLAVPPSRMGRADRVAWAINLYNFLVVEQIVKRLPPPGEPRFAGVLDIKTPEGGFFKSPVVEVEDLPYSLDAFERRFLFAEFERRPGAKPPAALDPRVHFAIVCGARGCPPLALAAYRGGSLDRDLDEAVRRSLASPAHLRWDEATRTLEASAIFEWYEADFGGRERAFAFLMRYAPAATRAAIERAGVKAIGRTIPWDWALNHVPHSGPLPGIPVERR